MLSNYRSWSCLLFYSQSQLFPRRIDQAHLSNARILPNNQHGLGWTVAPPRSAAKESEERNEELY